MAAGQLICCALGIACTSTADDESDIASDIKAGYAADAYFADGKNTRKFVHKDGGHYKDGAVVLTASLTASKSSKLYPAASRILKLLLSNLIVQSPRAC